MVQNIDVIVHPLQDYLQKMIAIHEIIRICYVSDIINESIYSSSVCISPDNRRKFNTDFINNLNSKLMKHHYKLSRIF